MSKIDLDFFEKIVIQQVLKKDNTYLASCVDHLEKELFKNKDILIFKILLVYLSHYFFFFSPDTGFFNAV